MVFPNGGVCFGKVSVLQPGSLAVTSMCLVANLVPALPCFYKKILKTYVIRITDGYKNAIAQRQAEQVSLKSLWVSGRYQSSGPVKGIFDNRRGKNATTPFPGQ